ncbi:unnamed protein product [Rhizopus stolonifer]
MNKLHEFSDFVTRGMKIDQENTRNEKLENNRLAAVKSREKKRQWLNDLVEKQDMLSNENKRLHTWVSELNEEIYQLKTQILMHKECESPEIDFHIQSNVISIIHKK